jgi:hypothetical protein
MGSRSFPEVPCVLCNRAVDLQTDLCADENGKAVHAECYVKRLANAQGSPPPPGNLMAA